MRCSGNSNHIFPVNSSSDLEQYLCNTTWSSQYLVFLLNSSVNFTISPGEFCQVATQQRSIIEIRSNSSTESANITCVHNDTRQTYPQSRRGLVFFNSQVTLKHLVIKNCGTYLTTIQDTAITDYLNSSSLYYTSSHAAALVFVHCQVNITRVNIYYSYGFAMVGVNLYNSTIDSVSMSYSSYSLEIYQTNKQSIGSGFLLHYMDINNALQEKNSIEQIYNMRISDAAFFYNYDLNTHSCITNTYHNKYSSSFGGFNPIVNAAGLTILYTQQNTSGQVSVYITESHFVYNTGSFAGGMFILQYHTFAFTYTAITNTVFRHNINFEHCHGAAVVFYWYSLSQSKYERRLTPLYFFNTSFLNHEGIDNWPISNLDYGAVYIGIVNHGLFHLNILFIRCTFSKNLVANTGACLYATVYEFADNTGDVSITLDSTNATENSQYIRIPLVSSAGIFYFQRIARVGITGTSIFSNNYGSVISSKDSNVYLSGNLTFNNNHATNGPAILLVGSCQLHFMRGVITKFTNNWAELMGGAIHARGDGKCVIHIDSNVEQIMFSDNEARRAGISIYAEPIFSCYINNSESLKSPNETMEYYYQHFNFIKTKSNSSSLLQFSTIPQTLTEGSDIQPPLQIYPGEEIYYCISAVDALGRKVYSTIAIDIVRNYSQHNIPKTTKVWLSFDDQEQLIQEGKNCTTISMIVHTNNNSIIISGMIVFSLSTQPAILTKSVKIHPCPLGFDLNKTTGVCGLSSSFDNLRKHHHLTFPILGNVSSQTITRLFTFLTWAGIIEYENKTKTQFSVSLACPIGYCNSNHTLPYFYSGDLSSNKSFKLSDGITDYHPPLCLYQREGTLCGRCSEGLSVVFGSTECQHCSNAWITSVSIYLVIGPLLIYLLYALKLTLTSGTLNGIIFYAQAANCGLLDMLRYHYFKSSIDRLSGFAIFIIHVLNLETYYPRCFYNGMTELWKTSLQFVFPLYLLTIIIVLIILSRFSTKLSNRIAHSSVQVLVTVVHLSFSKLLLQLINVMTYAEVYTSSDVHYVWYLDGTVKYGGYSHRILMIVTLIVVLGLLLPYVLLLLFAKPLRPLACTNKYLRPLLEAIHAPYKEGKQYWFTLRLLLLCAMYGVYAKYRATDLYSLFFSTNLMLVIFLVFQAYIKPFRSKLINLLDSGLVMNITLIYLTYYYLFSKDSLIIKIIYFSSVFVTFVTLVMVIVYHVLWVCRKLNIVKRWFESICEKCYLSYMKVSSLFTHKKTNKQPLFTDISGSFYGSCSEFREPVLGHCSD